MAFELEEDTRSLSNYIYLGSRELRRAFTEFFRFLFTELEFTEEFRWAESDNQTKIYIESFYPQDRKVFPRIVTEATPLTSGQLSLRDISNRDLSTGTLYYTGEHRYNVTIRVMDYELDPVEKIVDMCQFLLSIDVVRNNFAKLYKVYIEMPRGITTTAIIPVPLPGTDQNGFEATMTLGVYAQWEVALLEKDVETLQTISSEAVVDLQYGSPS